MPSPTISSITDRRVGIFGFGAEGRSVLAVLSRRKRDGAQDDSRRKRDRAQDDRARAGPPPSPAPLVLLDDPPAPGSVPPGVSWVAGEDLPRALDHIDVLVRSPGIRLSHPVLAAARARGIPVTTSSNLYLAEARAHSLPVVAVTGSKGKSTTATLLHRLLAAAGREAVLGGNIGVPPLDLLDEALRRRAVSVLELSSYQCADLEAGPEVAVFLSLFPEHMNWHGGVAAYYAAKLELARRQGRDDLTLFNAGDAELAGRVPLGPARHEAFQAASGLHFADGWFRDGERKLFSDREMRLRGRHNRINAIGALAAARHFGAAPEHLAQVLATFPGLPHRLEDLGCHAGIRWVNDSIATAPQASVAALEAFAGEVDTLIAGGSDRGFDFAVLAEALPASGVRNVILLPPGGEQIRAAIAAITAAAASRSAAPATHLQVIGARDLADAVEQAARLTASGRICLLSPGSPSYGLFRDFQDRGDQFRRLVEGLE
ncbi:MAG TPA: UDP-N-acetylmuramoyl-L-alanine--D-glutamate ligase [Thermoanaerobaculia bacterium]|nr:UDP-N-acetylmuramoyl-L-alanine--D-glutamate ligase [Thermoanaerobaculia bacterium]